MTLFSLYLGTIFLIIATPGPSALLVIQHGASYGPKKCLFNAAGSVSASLVLISLSLGGLTFIAKGFWIDILSIAGAILLLWIGVQSIKPINIAPQEDSKKEGWPIFKAAFYTGISNPKDLIFFATLLPQFILVDIPYWQSAIYLALGWCFFDFTIMMAYAFAAHTLTTRFSPSAINNTRAASGAMIIIIGCTLLFKTAVHLV
ncbi:LysE family translocator [Saccharospirillum salsuginis]|uniref:LysE family translocator n=1 Tax=Saccharospirillum salsuginis TaxID=418750 RepID=UPI001673A5BA|nr:LysE family translocator [Saccharospirillum salsuginis]